MDHPGCGAPGVMDHPGLPRCYGPPWPGAPGVMDHPGLVPQVLWTTLAWCPRCYGPPWPAPTPGGADHGAVARPRRGAVLSVPRRPGRMGA
eukprot:gene25768-biopygen21017